MFESSWRLPPAEKAPSLPASIPGVNTEHPHAERIHLYGHRLLGEKPDLVTICSGDLFLVSRLYGFSLLRIDYHTDVLLLTTFPITIHALANE